MSNNSSIQPKVNSRPEEWQIFLAINSYIMAIVSPSLNLLVVFVISRTKELRTPTNTFIASLAIGEVLFGMFSLPFAAASLLSNSWPFSTSVCKSSAFMQILGRTSGSYCLVFVCLDRYIAVSRPLKYTNIVTITFSIISTTLIWLFALFISILLLLARNTYNYVDILFMCTVDPRTDRLGNLVKEIICCYIPMFLILTCFIFVIKEVKSHHRIFAIVSMAGNTNIIPAGSSVVANILPLPQARSIRGFNRNTRRALRSFFIMALSYVVFCLPSSVSVALQADAPNIADHPAVLLPVQLSILYGFVNPLIIIFFNKKFRAQIKLIFKWWRCNKIHPAQQEVFTISSGLQTILDTTLIKNLGQGGSSSTSYSFRRSGVGHGI